MNRATRDSMVCRCAWHTFVGPGFQSCAPYFLWQRRHSEYTLAVVSFESYLSQELTVPTKVCFIRHWAFILPGFLKIGGEVGAVDKVPDEITEVDMVSLGHLKTAKQNKIIRHDKTTPWPRNKPIGTAAKLFMISIFMSILRYIHVFISWQYAFKSLGHVCLVKNESVK